MAKRLHLVFGGELKDTHRSKFRNLDDVEVIGLYSDYESAFNAWKEVSQMNVDNALMRYYIARLYRLIDEETATSPTAELES